MTVSMPSSGISETMVGAEGPSPSSMMIDALLRDVVRANPASARIVAVKAPSSSSTSSFSVSTVRVVFGHSGRDGHRSISPRHAESLPA